MSESDQTDQNVPRGTFSEISDMERIVPRGTIEKLEFYRDNLLKWQKAVNLVSPNTLNDAWVRHFVDSAQIAQFLPPSKASSRDLIAGSKPETIAQQNEIPWSSHGMTEKRGGLVLLDLGSGAGFPGLVLAIMHPEINVHLVESDGKKCEFLKNVSRGTISPVTIHNCRIENLDEDITPDVITARALADLNTLFSWILPYAAKNADLVLLLPKGENANEEIEEASEQFSFHATSHKSITNPKAQILEIGNLKKLPS